MPLPPSACSYPPITALAVFYNHPAPYHPSLGEGTGRIFPTTNHPNSLSTPPLGRGRGWVFPAPASLQSLRKKFTGPSVNFLQGPWSNLTAALENYYKAPGALLQGCWRNLTDTPGNLRRLPSCAQKFTCGAQNEKNGGIFIALHVLFSNFVGSKGHRK